MASNLDLDGIDADISADSIRAVADSLGISRLDDSALRALAEDVSFRLKQIVQESSKFARHSKRRKVTTDDFDRALQQFNLEPIYGFKSGEFMPFRGAIGGGREVHFLDDKEIELSDVISTPLPRLPSDLSLRAHWLAVEGVQPAIPENPPPVSVEKLKEESVNRPQNLKPSSRGVPPSLLSALGLTGTAVGTTTTTTKGAKETSEKDAKADAKKGEKQKKEDELLEEKFKEYVAHEMSGEQQLYYREITAACLASGDTRKTSEALQSLSLDPGLNQMLPKFTEFICEGIKQYVIQKKLTSLVALVKMIKALLSNKNLNLEKYIHKLLPAVLSTVVGKQLCARPDENHWSLRELGAQALAQICKSFTTTSTALQSRVTKLLSKILADDSSSLPQRYGAMVGLCELGTDVCKNVLLPQLPHEGELLRKAQNSNSEPEKTMSITIQKLLQNHLGPIIVTLQGPPDVPDVYRAEYGFLGPNLCNYVSTKLRAAHTKTQQRLQLQKKAGICNWQTSLSEQVKQEKQKHAPSQQPQPKQPTATATQPKSNPLPSLPPPPPRTNTSPSKPTVPLSTINISDLN
ncbi:transcription initiation factor TFIID subunit 6-like [Oscarella lobularis]|uniref:transcription initiation factor TFIID subunit 6-like n=1 Tax=Oscarella lobularis TaxID=121494 RepID=UPI003313266A